MGFPKTMGACIDQLYALREERHGIEKKADVVKKKESLLEAHVLETFAKSELDGARGKRATAGVTQTTVGTVKDWDKLYKYVVKHKAFELLQKRLSSTAYRERLDAKEKVPGVEPFLTTKLSLTKR